MLYFDAVRLSGLVDIDLPIIGLKPTDPYQVESIDGLGPPEQDLSLINVTMPGGRFAGRRSQPKQIVALVGLNPDYGSGQSIADLRYDLYGLLSPGVDELDQSIMFYLLWKNEPVAQTKGYIKRIEIVPFDRDPRVQITIDCLGPYLEAPEDTIVVPPDTTSWQLTNVGRAPTGIQFEIEFVQAVTTFSISVLNGASMNFEGDFQITDRLYVDTNPATRFAGQKRYTTRYDYIRYLDIMSADSKWILLHGGEHTIQTSDVNEFNWVDFKYRTRYWGV